MLIYSKCKAGRTESPQNLLNTAKICHKIIRFVTKFASSYIFPIITFSFSVVPCTTWHVLSYYYLVRLRTGCHSGDTQLLLFCSSTLRSFYARGDFRFTTLNFAKLCTSRVSRIKIEITRDSRHRVSFFFITRTPLTRTMALEERRTPSNLFVPLYLSRVAFAHVAIGRNFDNEVNLFSAVK